MSRFLSSAAPRWIPLLRQILPYLAAALLLLVLRQSRITERLNLLAYDLAVQLLPAPSGASTPVRIIGIDERDLNRYGPLIADGLLAEAVERLDRAGVRAIGLDMYCGQPVGSGWQRLRHLAVTNPRLVSVYFELDGKRAIPGTPPERQAYADIYTDPSDGLVRRDLLHVVGPQHEAKASLPMRLLEIATGRRDLLQRLAQNQIPARGLEAGSGGYLPEAGVAAPRYLQRMLPFHRPGSFPTWSLDSLLRYPLTPHQRRQLRDSIVLIGVVAPSSKDHFAVPFSLWRQSERRYEMPGVEIHAHRLAGLLALEAGRSLGIRAAPPFVNGLLLVSCASVGVILGERVLSLRRSLLLVAAALLLGLAAVGALLALGVWLDGALPLAALGLMATAAWIRRGANQQIRGDQLESTSRHVRTVLGRFVSNVVADELLDEARPGPPAGGLRTVTVLMADLRGYSLLSKEHSATTIVSLLNNYLAVMFEVVEGYGGTIDEVLGDSILVLFGAPLPRADHCEAALACALSMQLAMDRVNGANRQQGLPLVEMGIGLCTGEVIAGTIGSPLRAKYGVVGAAVNLAARIEELTVGGEVLAAESTVRGSGSPLRIDADYWVEFKGSVDPLLVHSIGAMAGSHDLVLPLPGSTRFELGDPIVVYYCLMNGKHREGLPSPAEVTHLAEREAWMVAKPGELAPFTNLALTFPGISEDAYGKVRETRNGCIHIVFTAMPGELTTMISMRCRL